MSKNTSLSGGFERTVFGEVPTGQLFEMKPEGSFARDKLIKWRHNKAQNVQTKTVEHIEDKVVVFVNLV